jgi:hypothetical protein
MMHKVSDANLNLPARWFTGREWADGTAQKFLIEEYRVAFKGRSGQGVPSARKETIYGISEDN